MSLVIGDNFQFLGSKPLDSRLTFSTLADMVAMADSTLYSGIMAYCVGEDKNYQWKSTNTVDPTLGKWREFQSGGGGDVTGRAKSTAIAPVFDDTETYAEGDRVMYEDELYVFNTAHTGAWDSSDVEVVTVMEEIPKAMSQSDVNDIKSAVSINPISIPQAMSESDVTEIKDAFVLQKQYPVIRSVPLGTIIEVLGDTAPVNYLECDGSTYNIEEYQLLADYINDVFGSYDYFGGDGVTTFGVPKKAGDSDSIYCVYYGE